MQTPPHNSQYYLTGNGGYITLYPTQYIVSLRFCISLRPGEGNSSSLPMAVGRDVVARPSLCCRSCPRCNRVSPTPPSSCPWTTTAAWIWTALSLRSGPSMRRLPRGARPRPRRCTTARHVLSGQGEPKLFLMSCIPAQPISVE